LSDIDIDDTNWYAAKEVLRTSYKGRSVVDWVENNLENNCKFLNICRKIKIFVAYVVFQFDAGKMAKAYVDDIVGFLDVANKENKRILSKTDLL